MGKKDKSIAKRGEGQKKREKSKRKGNPQHQGTFLGSYVKKHPTPRRHLQQLTLCPDGGLVAPAPAPLLDVSSIGVIKKETNGPSVHSNHPGASCQENLNSAALGVRVTTARKVHERERPLAAYHDSWMQPASDMYLLNSCFSPRTAKVLWIRKAYISSCGSSRTFFGFL